MLNKQGVKVKNLGWLHAMLKQLCDDVNTINSVALNELVNINELCIDSRTLHSGGVFVALSGFNAHGLDHAYQAEQAGAVAVITEPAKSGRAKSSKKIHDLSIPVIECDDLSGVLGELSSGFYDNPSQKLKVTAITGTNGKTSTAWLLMHALENLGQKAGYMGTLGVGGVDQMTALQNTTPAATTIQKNMAQMVADGYQHLCVEVSSHALDQGRFNGTQVDQAIYTNLSREHLDYHKTMEAYATTKLKLFTAFKPKLCIINADDKIGADWLTGELKSQYTLSYGIGQNTENTIDFLAENIELLTAGIAFDLKTKDQSKNFETALLGEFNVSNTLAVIASLNALGYELNQISTVVKNLTPVPGRMNQFKPEGKNTTVVVDYAHTPDALLQVLTALRAHTQDQLWCVFGCGGDRDSGKRALMGEIAEQHADQVIITDDNPRTESPAQIVNDIQAGMKQSNQIIHNRRRAIAYALNHAQGGDIIVVAGKGHESTQETNGIKTPFNDMEVAKELSKELQQVAS